MTFPLEFMLRGRSTVFSETVSHTAASPKGWTEADVAEVLRAILSAIHRAQHPEDAAGQPIALRGLSWIVTPHARGAILAIEIHSASAVAGPFEADASVLEALVERAVAAGDGAPTVH